MEVFYVLVIANCFLVKMFESKLLKIPLGNALMELTLADTFYISLFNSDIDEVS